MPLAPISPALPAAGAPLRPAAGRVGLALGLLLSLWTAPPSSAADRTPPGVEQLLPRGAIPALLAPRFVPAAAADIPDDAWVLGVELDGVAHAYSLNLLNRHEVVNDRLGELPVAAVW